MPGAFGNSSGGQTRPPVKKSKKRGTADRDVKLAPTKFPREARKGALKVVTKVPVRMPKAKTRGPRIIGGRDVSPRGGFLT